MKKNWDKGLQVKSQNKYDLVRNLRKGKKITKNKWSIWELLFELLGI